MVSTLAYARFPNVRARFRHHPCQRHNAAQVGIPAYAAELKTNEFNTLEERGTCAACFAEKPAPAFGGYV